jgi:hypothetical protein
MVLIKAGVKLKSAGQSAGTFVGEVAKDAKGNFSDVAGRVGLMVKSRWALLQQPSTKQAVQERLISAAATTGTLLRKGVEETKDKVVVGKTKVEEVILVIDLVLFSYLSNFLIVFFSDIRNSILFTGSQKKLIDWFI